LVPFSLRERVVTTKLTNGTHLALSSGEPWLSLTVDGRLSAIMRHWCEIE
jgi:hypothetical protein